VSGHRLSLRPAAIGAIAHAALALSGGHARVLARHTASSYLRAGDQIVWLGGREALLHPRAILVTAVPALESEAVRLDVEGLEPWRPPVASPATRRQLQAAWRAVPIAGLGTPGGFGALLTRQPLAFPLDGAHGAAAALAAACARDDAAAIADAASALLGLGGGLTPSGDDYVGGAFFARRHIADRRDDALAWRQASQRVRRTAAARTHPISTALLGDLIAGLGWAALHELLGALATGATGAALLAARRLVRLGHTSGWDMLAGVAAGLGLLDT
jgi:hypothetical protein